MEIRFYMTAAGANPVGEYLEDLRSEERARIDEALDDIRENDLGGAQVTARHIDGKLWELKLSSHRIFYVVITGPLMVLLHAYKKQGQKAPVRELETARRRAKEILDEEA